MACYYYLKERIIIILKYGYLQALKAKGKKNPNMIYNDEDWCFVQEEVQWYSLMLEDKSQTVDINNLNKKKHDQS